MDDKPLPTGKASDGHFSGGRVLSSQFPRGRFAFATNKVRTWRGVAPDWSELVNGYVSVI